MIFEIIHKISSLLNERLKMQFKLTKDIVKVQMVDNQKTESCVVVSMINMERDTSGGISFGRKRISGSHSSKGHPTWDLNLYIIIAAVFPPKQYADSLKIITEVAKILQANSLLPFHEYGIQYTIEPVNLTLHELSNVWNILGGSYFPSVICKIRTISIDSDTIIQIDADIEQRNVQI